MRTAGYLPLPSSRTLHDYSDFSEPKSGCQYDTLAEMRRQYNNMVTDGREMSKDIGILIFDKVKIKEGLVYDCSSGKLVGCVNDSRNVECDDELATNI